MFAKAPRPGAVKTRLIPLLGAEGAAALHARLIKHTLATARRAGAAMLELHGAPADDPFLRFCAARYNARLVEQCEGDLGARMHHAFERALADCRHALLIGTDCPSLSAHHLRSAGQALSDGNDAVLVPVEDGGYALVGLARCDARLFEGIGWSGPAVMDETRTRLRELDWRWTELESLWDVDRPADYERLLASAALAPEVRSDFRSETGG